MARPDIPDKPYFKIGEVAELAAVEPYVLRYWETEFKAIRPDKSKSRQRIYRRCDVETVLTIKHLLYEEGYRIEGAKRRLRELKGETPARGTSQLAEELGALVGELEAILDQDERGSTP